MVRFGNIITEVQQAWALEVTTGPHSGNAGIRGDDRANAQGQFQH